jgi:hypothetical protein
MVLELMWVYLSSNGKYTLVVNPHAIYVNANSLDPLGWKCVYTDVLNAFYLQQGAISADGQFMIVYEANIGMILYSNDFGASWNVANIQPDYIYAPGSLVNVAVSGNGIHFLTGYKTLCISDNNTVSTLPLAIVGDISYGETNIFVVEMLVVDASFDYLLVERYVNREPQKLFLTRSNPFYDFETNDQGDNVPFCNPGDTVFYVVKPCNTDGVHGVPFLTNSLVLS